MPEPHASTAGAVAIAAVAALTGDYSVIVFAAVAGGLWPLASATTQTRMDGFKLLFRLVATSLVFSWVIALVLESQFRIPATRGLAPASFLIAALGNRWQAIFDALGGAIARLFGSLGGRQP